MRPHAPTHIGDRSYRHDANGNQTGWEHDRNGTRRNIVWDEENRIQSVFDNGHEKFYKYDDQGERVVKRGPQGETVYVNQWYTLRNRGIATKHVWAGASRLASQLVPGAASGGPPASDRSNGKASNGNPAAGPTAGFPSQGLARRADRARSRLRSDSFPGQGAAHRAAAADLHAQNTVKNPNLASGSGPYAPTAPLAANFLYYYHPDHLGSSNLVTDADGQIHEHLEYFPFGETWVEESSNTQRTPYLFTGKELDEETGLYYFGARYYDPRTSVWQSADPILDRYLDGAPAGGVYNSFNLSLYQYGAQNSLRYKDPDGNSLFDIATELLPAAGKSMAAVAAYGVGLATGNQHLANAALEGMSEMQGSNIQALAASFNPVPGTGTAMRAANKVENASQAVASVAKKVDNAGGVAKNADTLKPGPFAKESIPAHRGRPTAAEQKQVNELMEKHGCHTCGTKNPGTKSGNAVADHQPPQALGEPKEFLPHCIDCARRQGGQVLQEKLRNQ